MSEKRREHGDRFERRARRAAAAERRSAHEEKRLQCMETDWDEDETPEVPEEEDADEKELENVLDLIYERATYEELFEDRP